MERLSAEDQLMLWPDAIWPQDIGAVGVLDGRRLLDSGGRLRIDSVRHTIEARLHRVPRFRQLLHRPRRGLGPPLWVDAPAFDVADHVRVVPLPGPADEAALLHAVERLRRRRLDMSRPLWQMTFLPGLPDSRIGLYVRMHHAIADGVAGVATIGAFVDAGPDGPPETVRPWTPAPAPTARGLLADNLHRHVDRLGRTLPALAQPVATVQHLAAQLRAPQAVFAGQPTPATSLNRRVGADRALALVRTRLDRVKRIAHRNDATVNDVLLAAIAAGLRALLTSRGEPVDDLILPVYVPKTLRTAAARAHARGNRIAQTIVPLPVGVADVVRRLHAVTAATAVAKAQPHRPLGAALRGPLARAALLRILSRHPVNVTTANVPGPGQDVFLAGARLLEVFPVLPLVGNVSLGVGALSYAGQFNITVVADPDCYPDLDVFTLGVENGLRDLDQSTRPAGSVRSG
jgi:diacylglycerol O-acyltransferase / wax synthase